MSVLTGKELRIVGFLCNWCSYGGADTAGVARFTQPTDLRIIRVPCSGRVNPLFPLKALLSGADGVLVSGCHPRDCHYSEGNFYARRRLEVLKEFLPIVGIDPRRFEYTWVSASEGQRWQQVVTAFTDRIHKLGPAPRFEDARPIYDLPALTPAAPLRPLGCGTSPALAELKDQIKAALEAKEVEFVMGWQIGHDPLHTTPLFMRTPEDVDKLMDSKKANLVLTDPPYGVSFKASDGLTIQNDSLKGEEFYKFLLAAFKNMADHLEKGGAAYCFHADTEGLTFRKAFIDAGFHLAGVCIWVKNSLVLGRSDYQWQHEPCLFGWKKNGKHQWYSDRKQTTIWEFDKPNKSDDHPTMKPVPLIAYTIKNSSMSNCIVLDPFGGSGSTLIACEQTNRICYSIELDEKYCDVIVKRWETLTGQKAELEKK